MTRLQFKAPKAAVKALKKLPKDVQEDFVTAIENIRDGRDPDMLFEHLNKLGKNVKGVIELKINGSPAYRMVYVAKFNNTLYMLHAFTKTSEKADKKALDTVVNRYKDIHK
jgi:phage-related protein